jgi:hypothetical protein
LFEPSGNRTLGLMTGRVLLAAFIALAAGCRHESAAPTTPTMPSATVIDTNVAGVWTGTFAVTRCTPMAIPGDCRPSVPFAPEPMTLTLTQAGDSLSGTFETAMVGSIPISGTIDSGGIMHLSGVKPGNFRCFEASTPDVEVGDWTTEITKTGDLSGTFRQSRQQLLSSCYTGRFDYFSQVLSLHRAGAVPSLPLPQPAPNATRISGRILNASSGAPAPAVEVSWLARAADYAVLGGGTVMSDSAGQYSVLVPAGEYYAITFTDASMSDPGAVRLAAGQAQADLLVAPGACNWMRYGYVIDASTRQPLGGARVSASGKSTTTRADGFYLLDWGCTPSGTGSRNLTVEQAGYRTAGQFWRGTAASRGLSRFDFALSPQ